MPLTLPDARRLADELTHPGRFFAAPGLALARHHRPAETLRWEVFQGRLLLPEHTRQEATFESWNVHLVTPEGPTPEPALSLKLAADGRLHVVRAVDSYVQEGYDSGGGVYLTREARRWARELVATFDPARFDTPAALRDELAAAIGRALHGARLPLTPTEAPHPLFSFGRLFYHDRPPDTDAPSPMRDLPRTFATHPRPHRALEAWLRALAPDDLPAAARELRLDAPALLPLLWDLFQDVSLSPWTDLAPRALTLLAAVATPVQALDFEARLLRLIARHLTAYDLVTFHHRGANYPDALLLDAVLTDYLARLQLRPDLFLGDEARPRRRALRQAWALRRAYEGHPVPDLPTSPGEQARAYPDDYPRVPEEQVLQPARRRLRLFRDDPLTARLSPPVREALAASLADLLHPAERRELGAAAFLDRPFGGAKAPVEPDATPLLASLAYSRFIAGSRLRQLALDLGAPDREVEALSEQLALPGLPLEAIGPPVRPGTLGLADAARAAPDFLFQHTLPGSVRRVMALFDFTPLAAVTDLSWLTAGPALLARPAGGEGLTVYDAGWRPRLTLTPVLDAGYATHHGLEWPAGGLLVTSLEGQPAALPLPAKGATP